MKILFPLALFAMLHQHAWAIKTDFGTYSLPALAAMGPAGSKVVDPVFGTTIMRLTDGSDGNSGAGTLYSYYPSFNRDNTFVIANQFMPASRVKVFPFNASAFAAGAGFFLANPPPGLQEYNVTWSGTDPHVLYGVGNHSIWAINVVSKTNTLIKDLSAWGEGGYITQMLKSLDDNAFAASLVNGSGATVGYIHYRRSTDRVTKTLVSNVDEVMVDKSGRYLLVVFNSGVTQVWDYQNATPVMTGSMTGVWHRDAGQGSMISAHSGNSMGFRRLADPNAVTVNLAGYIGFSTQQDHISFQADNETWALLSRYTNSSSGGPVLAPFDNEVFQFTTDGSNQVRRICHHRMVGNAYDSTPKANISRDGRYVAFTSNWGNVNGRRDLYIAQIPQAPGGPVSDTTPPSTPTGLTATAASASQINLAWNASTDNVGVAGYKVFRGGVQIATVTSGTSFANTGLTAGTTYTYRVSAFDAAGNGSGLSTAASSFPAAQPPLSISMTVACAPNCPLNGTTTDVRVTVNSGSVSTMEFSRDGFPVFLTCPGGSACAAPPNWGFTWCISSSCWGGVEGQHTLYATARDSAGRSATASVTMNVSDSPPPPAVSNAIAISVPAGLRLPNSGTTAVLIAFSTGTPASVTLARGATSQFAQWPSGNLSQYFTQTADGLSFDLCLEPSCGIAPGPLTLTANGSYPSGSPSTASASITITIQGSTSSTDLNGDGVTNVFDVQLGVNQALGLAACATGDIDGSGACNVMDVQRIVNAALAI